MAPQTIRVQCGNTVRGAAAGALAQGQAPPLPRPEGMNVHSRMLSSRATSAQPPTLLALGKASKSPMLCPPVHIRECSTSKLGPSPSAHCRGFAELPLGPSQQRLWGGRGAVRLTLLPSFRPNLFCTFQTRWDSLMK